jgi:anti-anti-sigma regulatory factor
MFRIHFDHTGDMIILECEGSILGSDASLILRNAVTSQTDARLLILDFSEVDALDGVAVGMLAFLQRWAEGRHIRLKLFNPSHVLLQRLGHTASIPAFEFATMDELIAYLSPAGHGETMTHADLGATGRRHG